jgi:hypothetical protein
MCCDLQRDGADARSDTGNMAVTGPGTATQLVLTTAPAGERREER